MQCLFHLKDFNEGFIPVNIASEKSHVLQKYLNLFDNVMDKNSDVKDLSTLPLKKSVCKFLFILAKICSLFIDFHQ